MSNMSRLHFFLHAARPGFRRLGKVGWSAQSSVSCVSYNVTPKVNSTARWAATQSVGLGTSKPVLVGIPEWPMRSQIPLQHGRLP